LFDSEQPLLDPQSLPRCSQCPIPLVEAPLSNIEALDTLSESPLHLSTEHEPIVAILLSDDSHELMGDETANALTHRDPNDVAVPPPR